MIPGEKHWYPCPRARIVNKRVRGGFTLIELLVVIAIIAVLASLSFPALSKAKGTAQRIKCVSQMRQLSLAVRMYASDYGDTLPRSQHSAFSFRQYPWAVSILPYLGQSTDISGHRENVIYEGVYRCPKVRKPRRWSYGLNVYFELGEYDDYRQSPATWRKMSQIPKPSSTILLGEVSSNADHIMAHFWEQETVPSVAIDRHGKSSIANYSYVDGHVESRDFSSTFDQSRRVDQWHPLGAKL